MLHLPAANGFLSLTAIALSIAFLPVAAADPPTVGHPHPRAVDGSRFHTDRDAAALPLPGEEDAFFFAVFGDRTGGPRDGVKVLAQAVADVNLLEPDPVMTVGDLVEGYNGQERWLEQMSEFKGIMDNLLCPWFPVAGNHDIYWRGPDRPAGEHEQNYETHFGPLWYAFEHKNCWFIALYSDEGNPATGEKTFNKPASQVMSPEQLAWLQSILEKAADARHVFVFIHHPRWLGGGYGDDWDRVHDVLAAAGNVRAVFAGHIHRMRHDGFRDGIEYLALATVGGHQPGVVPEAGYLHHFNTVTVRGNQIAMASFPVGSVMDVRAITGEISDETGKVAGMLPAMTPIEVAADGSSSGEIVVALTNPAERPIEVAVAPVSDDSRWRLMPDHRHATVEGGATRSFAFHVAREAGPLDDTFRPVYVTTRADYLADGARFAIPQRVDLLPARVNYRAEPAITVDRGMRFNGRGDALILDDDRFSLPDGPLTVECWCNGDDYSGRTGLVAKTENSDYGLFVSDGIVTFSVFLGERYTNVATAAPILEAGRWHHIAGVHDGEQTRVYVDGVLVASANRSGKRRMRDVPLVIGGDSTASGAPMSYFDGLIDEVRLSSVARYHGEAFTPPDRLARDGDTVLLLHMDETLGPWAIDDSDYLTHPVMRGGPELVPVERPTASPSAGD